MDFGKMWVEGLAGMFEEFSGFVEKFLPKSPLAGISISDSIPAEYLGYLNWFLPVGLIINTMNLILAAIAAYYLISILLRWLKVIA